MLRYLQEHTQEVVLDKSVCVLVCAILGSAPGDVQPAMDAIASLAAAELHPGGEDGEVMSSSRSHGAVRFPVIDSAEC